MTQHAYDAENLRAMVQALAVQAETDQQLITALQAKGATDQAQIGNLEVALTTSRRIGAAVGILMATRKITYDEAFMALRDASQRGHRKLREIADDVVVTGVLPTSDAAARTARD